MCRALVTETLELRIFLQQVLNSGMYVFIVVVDGVVLRIIENERAAA